MAGLVGVAVFQARFLQGGLPNDFADSLIVLPRFARARVMENSSASLASVRLLVEQGFFGLGLKGDFPRPGTGLGAFQAAIRRRASLTIPSRLSTSRHKPWTSSLVAVHTPASSSQKAVTRYSCIRFFP